MVSIKDQALLEMVAGEILMSQAGNLGVIRDLYPNVVIDSMYLGEGKSKVAISLPHVFGLHNHIVILFSRVDVVVTGFGFHAVLSYEECRGVGLSYSFTAASKE